MNGAHAHFFLFQLALVHQPAPDRPVGVAVLVGVTQAQLAAIFQLYPAGTLDLQELQVHRVGQPGQHRCLDAVTVDHLGGVVRFEHPAIETTAQALALELGVHAGQVDHDHVLGNAVDRHVVGRGLAQAARVDRLVVTGDQAVGVVLGGTQAVYLQVLLEESAHLGGACRGTAGRFAGGGPHRVALELFTAAAPGVKAGQQVFIANRRQVFPGGLGVGGDGVGLGLGVLAAVAAGEQSQHRECPGQMAQGRFHKCVPVMGEHEYSPLFFMWLLVFGPWAAILAAHLRRPK
ncbi:hypothetical protein D3C81_1357900 [compost metagenome]